MFLFQTVKKFTPAYAYNVRLVTVLDENVFPNIFNENTLASKLIQLKVGAKINIKTIVKQYFIPVM
jgi:hypothetical protein